MNIAPHLAALYGWPLLILALGIYSVTRLITTDSFPPIEALRTKLYEHFPHDGFTSRKRPRRGVFIGTSAGNYYVNIGHWLGELVHCPWCAGWWVSAARCACFWFWPVATVAVLVPFALRIIPGVIESIIT